ncbi:hypothetical protein [Nocardiopsis valliformis]|uniref:hypothetical protein n=1 Tax=Nocardiopsis valliformis TaxID=239974 RepID=UPI0003778D3B|nr:hypothetical protein [Nocardiopsis valliformis]
MCATDPGPQSEAVVGGQVALQIGQERLVVAFGGEQVPGLGPVVGEQAPGVEYLAVVRVLDQFPGFE